MFIEFYYLGLHCLQPTSPRRNTMKKHFFAALALVLLLTATHTASAQEGLVLEVKTDKSDYMSGEPVRVSVDVSVDDIHHGRPASVYLTLSYQKDSQQHLVYYLPEGWVHTTIKKIQPLTRDWIMEDVGCTFPDITIETDEEILEVTVTMTVLLEEGEMVFSIPRVLNLYPVWVETLLGGVIDYGDLTFPELVELQYQLDNH